MSTENKIEFGDWIPMTTTPPIGEPILVAATDGQVHAVQCWENSGKIYFHCDKVDGYDCNPEINLWDATHWMPFPNPPQAR